MDSKQIAFAKQIYSDAYLASGSRWIAEWMTAITCHESGWGDPKNIPEGSFNPIGYMWEKRPNSKPQWEWVESKEAGTKELRRFRKFASFRDCMGKLLYLIKQSTNPNYQAARDHYKEHVASVGDTPEARKCWMLDFSKGFCPVDQNHGEKVLNTLKLVKEVLG